MKYKPGDLVVVLGKSNTKCRDQEAGKLMTGTYIGDLRGTNEECYVLLENGDIWVGMRRDLAPLKEQA